MEVTLGRAITIIIALAVVLLLMFGYSRIAGQASDTGGGMFSMFTDIMEFFGIRTGRISLESITITDIKSDGSVGIELVLIRPQGHIIDLFVDDGTEPVLQYTPTVDEKDRRIIYRREISGLLSETYGEKTIRVTAKRDGRDGTIELGTRTIRYIRPGLQGIEGSLGSFQNIQDNNAFWNSEHNKRIIREIHNLCDQTYSYCCSGGTKCNHDRSPCSVWALSGMGYYDITFGRTTNHLYRFSLSNKCEAYTNKDNINFHNAYRACLPEFLDQLRSYLNNECRDTRAEVYYTDHYYVLGTGLVGQRDDTTVPVSDPISVETFEYAGIGPNGFLSFNLKINNADDHRIILIVDRDSSNYITLKDYEDGGDTLVLQNHEIPVSIQDSIFGTFTLLIRAQSQGYNIRDITEEKRVSFLKPLLPGVEGWIGDFQSNDLTSISENNDRFWNENSDALIRINSLCRETYSYCCREGLRDCLKQQDASPCSIRQALSRSFYRDIRNDEKDHILHRFTIATRAPHCGNNNYQPRWIPIFRLYDPWKDHKYYDAYNHCLPIFLEQLRLYTQPDKCDQRDDVIYDTNIYVKW
ncbi:MAG: hypothetical protein ACMXYL_04635 [Candidatus Woesearchaeota archaeon]